MSSALILVDLQNDFFPGGPLGVPNSLSIIPLINRLTTLPFAHIIATKDWHPQKHVSFASTHQKKIGETIMLDDIQQILWPDHCIQGTPGADFHPDFNTQNIETVIFKGTNIAIDSYSSFFDNAHKRKTGLEDYLRANEITKLYIAGLATDYCVKYSALDARHLGFQTYVITDACQGVNLTAGDSDKALLEMKKAGIELITAQDAEKRLALGN